MKVFSRYLTLLTAVAALLAVLAPAAQAADPTAGDSVTIPLGKKGSGLRVKGVKFRAIKPAKVSRASVSLPVSDVSLPHSGEGRLVLRGGFELRAGKRKLALQGLLVTVTASKLTITGKAGKSRFQLFSGKPGKSTIDATKTAVTIDASQLKPSARLVRSLKKALKNKRFKAKSLGRMVGASVAYYPPLKETPPDLVHITWDEPALPERPVTAGDVTSATPLDWWARKTWVNYVGMPAQATGVTAIGMENKCGEPEFPPVEHTNSWRYPFVAAGSWYDAASGTGVLKYSGAVRFFFPDRFDITFADPEVVIRPTGSTMNMKIFNSTYPGGRRAEMFILKPGAGLQYQVMTTVAVDGVFGGLYPYDESFGCSVFSFTQP